MKLRVEGDKRFPGFRDARVPTHVTRDGERIHGVIAVDTSSGIAWRHKRGHDGCLVIDYQRNEVEIECITGSFRIVAGGPLR